MKGFNKILWFIIQIISFYKYLCQKFCGIDSNTYEVKYPSYKPGINSRNQRPIQIYIERNGLSPLSNSYSRNNVSYALNFTIEKLQKLIEVKPLNYRIAIERNDLVSWGFENYPTELLNGIDTDLIVLIKIVDDGEYLTKSELKYIDEVTKRPIVAILYIDSNYVTPINLRQSNYLRYIEINLLHQFTHILGFLYNTFNYFPGGLSSVIKSVDSDERSGVPRNYIITNKVMDYAKKYYNCNDILGVELEDQDGRTNSHWEARILLGEYMNSEYYNLEVAISEFTLALLEDSGWYKVNYYTGGLMRFGKNKGCSFLKNDCTSPSQFKNEFSNVDEDTKTPACSSGRQSRGYNTINDGNRDTFGEFIEYNRFTGENAGKYGIENADFCLGFNSRASEESYHGYLVGSCKYGNSNYGGFIVYSDGNQHSNKDLDITNGEKYGNNTFCVLTSVSTIDSTGWKKSNNNINHPMCYPMFCSERSLTIQIYNQYVVCPRSGGKVRVDGNYEGYVFCPDYNLICTGTVLCNDIFDCIDKNSTIKESTYEYDYEIKTTQIKNELINSYFESMYELSEEGGECPQYCEQCFENKKCFICKDFFLLIGDKENDLNPIICSNSTNVSSGYYLNVSTNVYFPCTNFCLVCDSTYCQKCDNIHKLNEDNTLCIDKVENCEIYNDSYICVKCKGDYVFIKENRDECFIIDRSRYFSRDNNISFYPCNTSIGYCDICNNKEFKCDKCIENYYFLEEDRENCINNKDLTEYFSEDNNISYYPCDKNISHCLKCSGRFQCTQCKENYFFIRDDYMFCRNDFNKKKYYLDNDGKSYYPCNESVIHCDECELKNQCQKCDNNYFFIGEDRSNCTNGINFSQYYTKDNGISYYPCDTNFPFCDICENENKCIRCKKGYGFLENDRSKCIYVGSNEYYSEDEGLSFYPCSTNLQNCEQCLNKTYCIKCNNSYYFIEYDRTRCFKDKNLDEYYTEDNGTSYFPCNTDVSHCKACISKINCSLCEASYYFIAYDRMNCVNDRNLDEYYTLDEGVSYFHCHQAMENCKNCIIPTTCMQCQENTYFLRNDLTKCHSLNLDGYYTEDGKSYFPCNESMQHCSECFNKNFCKKCNINFFLKFEIPDICYELSTFQNDKAYFKLNETHYKKCSSAIDNCVYCNSGTECIQCENDYYFINDNYQECININQLVPEDEYYKIDDKNYYSCGYQKGVEFCKKCHNSTICLLCDDRYAFVNDLFNKCYSKNDMKIGYYHNDEDTIYYPCISNCDYCTNGSECQQCSTNNELMFYKTICGRCLTEFIYISDNLNLETIHSLFERYFQSSRNNLTYIPHYINQNLNYTITIFKSWECTKQLFSQGLFSLDTEALAKKIIEITKESITSLTYIFVDYAYNKSYFEIYDSNGILINLNQICSECIQTGFKITSNLTKPITNAFGKEILKNIIENNINIFNETDQCFDNFCSNFTLQNFDIPIKERSEILFLGNIAKEVICLDATCEIENITISQLTGSCKCKANTDLTSVYQPPTKTLISFNSKGKNNFPIFTCFKEGFNNSLKSNAGFFIGIVFIIIQIIAFIVYLVTSNYINSSKISKKKSKSPANPPLFSSQNLNINPDELFIEDFDKIFQENGMNKNNDFQNQELDFQDRDDLSDDIISEEDDGDIGNKRTLDHLLSEDDPRGKSKKNKNKAFDTYSVNIHAERKQRNEKLFFKSSENESEGSDINSYRKKNARNRTPFPNNKGEVNSKSSFDSGDGLEEIKQIRKKMKNNVVYSSLSDARVNKKTSFCEFYLFILGLRQPIINLFVSYKCTTLGDEFVPFSIKLIRFLFLISLNIFMNTLHLNHKYFYKKFEYFDKLYDLKNIFLENKISNSEIFSYAFKNSYLLGLASFVFCFLVQELLNRYIISNRKKIDNLLNSKNGKINTNDEIKEILKKSRIKYIIVVIFGFIFMFGFYYCISNFYAVYKGGIIDYLTASLWTFIFIQVFPFILCLIFAFLRYLGIKNSNNSLFKAGQLLVY